MVEQPPQDRIFRELSDHVDAMLKGMGNGGGIQPGDEPIQALIPPTMPYDGSWLVWDFSRCEISGHRVVGGEILLPARLPDDRAAHQTEEVRVRVIAENPLADKFDVPRHRSRDILFTVRRDALFRDAWVDVPEWNIRWSLFRGFVARRQDGRFEPASLPETIDEASAMSLAWSFTLTVTGTVNILKSIRADNEQEIDTQNRRIANDIISGF